MSRHDRREKKSSGSIPDRWRKCPRKSFKLFFDKFLVFKTPLSHKYDKQLKEEYYWPVNFVFDSMKSYKVKLGLWVDLTYTSRFYDKQDVEDHDCRYVKLQCRGFGQPPTEEQTQLFIEICHNFIKQYPLEVIGVHCTHGFNRSGFLLVSFLVEKFDWELRAALQKFAEVRPPGIYKKDYLVELYKRYDDPEFVPEAPPLPAWCYEDEDEEDEEEEENVDDGSDNQEEEFDKNSGNENVRKRKNQDSNEETKGKHKKRKKEFVKKNPTFMEGVPGVEPVSGSLLKEIQETVKRMCDWRGSGFPGSQPVSMTKENMKFLINEEYSVSWKADGFRYLMYIKERDEIYFIDRDNCAFKVRDISFPYRKNLNQHCKKTLLDGEMVIDKFNGQNIPRYLVYDVIVLNGYDIRKNHFMPTRYEAIKVELIDPRCKAMQLEMLNRAREPFSIRRKEFCHARDAKKFLSEKFFRSLCHEPDGLIFQPSQQPYIAGKFDMLLKWKPPSLNSVDFRLKIVTENGVGILPKKIGELYVNGLDSKFGVLKSVKNVKDLNNKIIECKFENGGWVFMRERTDKSFPNSYETAIKVVDSIANPVMQDELLKLIDSSCFRPPPPVPHSHSSHRFH